MDSFDIFGVKRKVDIPEKFRTFISEEYFQNCISCNKYLLKAKTLYVIEKAIKDKYVEFEYAMCMDCAEKMRKNLSDLSLARIGKYFEDHIESFDIRNTLIEKKFTTVDDYLSTCLINGSPIKTLNEYQIFAYCEGDKLLVSYFPYMISHEAIEDMQELLSAQTKDELDDFTKKHFDLPPEWKETIKGKKIILI